MKKPIAMLLSLTMLAGLMAGCGSQSASSAAPAQTSVSAAETTAPETEAPAPAPVESTKEEAVSVNEEAASAQEEEENYETGDASLDDTRNQDDIGEKELLVVSFGTSYNDSRRLTIGAIEGAIAEACQDYSVRRGFTSQIIIDHVKKRDNVVIDNVTEAYHRQRHRGTGSCGGQRR